MVIKTEATRSEGQQGGVTAGNLNVQGDLYVVGALPLGLLDEAADTLTMEGQDRPYSVLLCPAKSEDPEVDRVFSEIVDMLNAGGYSVHISDPDLSDEKTYWHLDEANFISDKRCNSIVVFVGDVKTFSQLSLFTLLLHRKEMELSRLDISIISVSQSDEPYFLHGCLLYAEDNISKKYSIDELKHSGPSELIKYLDRKRATHYTQSRGSKKVGK